MRLSAQSLQLDGQILGSGGSVGSLTGGGGSGGGIYVDVGSLSGSGYLKADGGLGRGEFWGQGSTPGGGGGGGRVAVYARDFGGFDLAHITALGGTTNLGNPGGAGTVHIVQGRPHTHVRSHSPVGINGGYFSAGHSTITLTFNKAIDLSSFDASDLVIDGQMGRLQATEMVQTGARTYQIKIPALTENGPYHFTLLPTLLDAEGFQLDQNANGIPGEVADTYPWDLWVDTIPPRATQHAPAGDIAGTISSVDVWFSEAIDKTTFTTADVTITKPDSQTLGASGIQEVGFNRFRFSFPPQTLVGQYHVKIGPDVCDLAGNQLDQDRDGKFGEPVDDVYDAKFSLAAVDLGLSDLVVEPAELWAGEPATISWAGQNRTGAPLLGDWTDGVYLSADDRWDINDTLLATVPHTGGLAENQPYTGSATVLISGKLPGNYHILVRADVRNQEKEGTGKADNLIDSGPISVSIRTLQANGSFVKNNLTASDRSDYYAVRVEGGQSLGLILASQSSDPLALYASFERQDADAQAADPRRRQELALTAPAGGGTYYLLAYSDATQASVGYDIAATSGDFVVTGLTPQRASNKAPDTDGRGKPVGRVVPSVVTLNGAGFTETMQVEFIASDGTSRLPTRTDCVSTSQLTAQLDLPNWPAGIYDVRLTKGTSTYTLADAFTVVAGFPNLETNLVLPGSLGFSIPIRQTIWIEYANTGNAPMPAPILRLYGDHAVRITTDINLAIPFGGFGGAPAGVGDTVQVVATGSGTTPDILQPGDRGRIPIYYIGLGEPASYPQITFTLSTSTADYVLWWDGYWSGGRWRPELRGQEYELTDSLLHDATPVSIVGSAQSHISTSIRNVIGYYVVGISNIVTHLHQIGQDVYDVFKLWGFAVSEAANANHPVRYLAAALDASVATPGLPLTFGRTFGQSFLARIRNGPMGFGWCHNWEYFAEALPEGGIAIRGPGGADRFFDRDRTGNFVSAPGDYGRLTSSAGTLRLTESDGTALQFRTDGNLDYIEDRNGNRITLGFTAGKLTSLTHSNGQQLLIDYDVAGRVWHVTDPQGPGSADDRVTTYEYDPAGPFLSRVIAPGNRITQYRYDATSKSLRHLALLEAAYPDGTHDYFEFNKYGQLVETSRDGGAERVRFEYPGVGEVKVIDATGRATIYEYGLGGQLAQVRDGLGNTLSLGYDRFSQLTRLTGPNGERYNYSYDSRGNLVGMAGSEYVPVIENTTSTSVTLYVQPGHTFAFYSIARDNVGHVEAAPATPDTQITVLFGSWQGTEGDDNYAIRLNEAGDAVEFVNATPTEQSPTFSFPLTLVSAVSFAGLGGNDTLTVDLSNGNPLVAGLTFDGGEGVNTLRFISIRATDTLAVSSDQVLFGTTPIAYTSAVVQLDGTAITLNSLSIGPDGKVTLPSGGDKVLRVNALTIADNGTLDLADNDLIVQATAEKAKLDRTLLPFRVIAAAWSGGVMLDLQGSQGSMRYACDVR